MSCMSPEEFVALIEEHAAEIRQSEQNELDKITEHFEALLPYFDACDGVRYERKYFNGAPVIWLYITKADDTEMHVLIGGDPRAGLYWVKGVLGRRDMENVLDAFLYNLARYIAEVSRKPAVLKW